MKAIGILFTLMLLVCACQWGQSSVAESRTGSHADEYWFFYVFQTKVHPEEVDVSAESPEEKRVYVSDVALLPEDVPATLVERKVIPFFNDHVVEPAKHRHIDIEYFGADAILNGGAVNAFASKAEAEDSRKKDIEQRKTQGGNVYSFSIAFGPVKENEPGPQLIYRDKGQPNYDVQPKTKGKK